MKPLYEVVIAENATASLTNPELKANIKEMMVALSKGKSAIWQYAFAVHKIINEGQFEDDFGTLKEFANFTKTSTATLSQYDKAVDFVCRRGFVQYELQRNGKKRVNFEKIPWTVSNAYLASTLSDGEYDRLVAFASDVDLSSLSQNKLKALINEWKLSEQLEDCVHTQEPEDSADSDTSEEDPLAFDSPSEDDAEETPEEARERAFKSIQELVIKFGITYPECIRNIHFPPDNGDSTMYTERQE